MWSCVLMRPGETTPLGQVIVVAPAAIAEQSQATHAILPAASIRTCPPWSTVCGARISPEMSFWPSPATTSQVPVAIGARTAQSTDSGDGVHSGSHPSYFAALPSSQSSPGSTAPSPHTGSDSSWQPAEQPSPPIVLPSSQVSPGSVAPSPHTGAVSLWQVAEQPSPGAVLPSSQVSPGSVAPLPQRAPPPLVAA